MKLVLASGSKFRQKILEQAGLKFDCITSTLDEEKERKKINATSPIEYVLKLSQSKADNVSQQVDEGIILAADTIVFIDNEYFEKPKTRDEAIAMTKKIAGKTNKAVTGMTIIDLYTGKKTSFYELTEITFNEMSDTEIEWYVDNEEFIFNCAGYSISGKSIWFISKIKGDFFNVVGLPLCKLYSELKKMGYNLADFD